MTTDDYRLIATNYFEKEQGGALPVYADGVVLPPGFGLEIQDGCLVRVPIASETAVVQFLGAGGYPRQTWVRRLDWSELDDRFKRDVWDDGIVPQWRAPESGHVFQAGNFMPDELVWAECMGRVALTPEEALAHTIPWHIIYSWQGEGLGICHALFYLAEMLHAQEKEAITRARAAAKEEEERLREQERAEGQAFREAYDQGRRAVSYRNGKIPVAGEKDGVTQMGEWDGYNIITNDGEETGFGVFKWGSKGDWSLTHKGTGLRMPDFWLPSRENALSLAGMFYAAWTGWDKVATAAEIPQDARQAAVKIVQQYRSMMGLS